MLLEFPEKGQSGRSQERCSKMWRRSDSFQARGEGGVGMLQREGTA
jgi:hypothetical protein